MKTKPENKYLVGVDVGGTKVAVIVVKHGQSDHANSNCKATDEGLVSVTHLAQPTRLESPQATLDGIIATIQATLAQIDVVLAKVAAVGFGIPGQVDPQRGLAQLAVNLNWRDVAAGAALSQALGVPCFLENDVRTAALGVSRHPRYQKIQNLAYLSVGTGIAAGLILDGRLYRGVHGMAGEIGHAVLIPEGPLCACGGRGCLEALASGPAIAGRTQEALANGAPSSLANMTPLKATAVFQACEDGDELARRIVVETADYLAQAIHNLMMAYDVEVVVLGGGVGRAGCALLEPLQDQLARRGEASNLARQMLPPEIVQPLPPGFEPGLWGAVALAKMGLAKSS
jgi:glucokinase